jgi:hypothetical protein
MISAFTIEEVEECKKQKLKLHRIILKNIFETIVLNEISDYYFFTQWSKNALQVYEKYGSGRIFFIDDYQMEFTFEGGENENF